MTSFENPRLKRTAMRSWRRGIREMDVILGPYFDASGAMMSEAELSDYEMLLAENDHDLYQWVSGQVVPPKRFESLILDIRQYVTSV